ncbi:MAG: hypothetical protein KJ955_01030 [Nanoarchaeota archaeon]|nr:hypothetical protein [Nanoarchaeota archaeon]
MDLLVKIEDNFKRMAATGNVDMSVIEILTKLKEQLVEIKKELLAKGSSIRDDFPKFHALETQLRIIEHMISRVKIAPEIHDNPKVADDALIVLPDFMNLHESLASKKTIDGDNITDLSSSLQISAMKCNMYPSTETVTKSVNTKMLNVQFDRFVSRVGGEIERL